MASSSLARRYARALVLLGAEDDSIDAMAVDLADFSEVLDLDGGMLRAALDNRGLTVIERSNILGQVLMRLELHAYVNNFLRLLVDKGRFAWFDDIREEYGTMADERAGRVRAVVTTAHPFSAELAAELLDALQQATGKQVLVSMRVDPRIIGGVVARVGDTVYDASVLGRLEDIRLSLRAQADA